MIDTIKATCSVFKFKFNFYSISFIKINVVLVPVTNCGNRVTIKFLGIIIDTKGRVVLGDNRRCIEKSNSNLA